MFRLFAHVGAGDFFWSGLGEGMAYQKGFFTDAPRPRLFARNGDSTVESRCASVCSPVLLLCVIDYASKFVMISFITVHNSFLSKLSGFCTF